MKTKITIGILAGLLCLAMPFISRIPRGSAWVAQYLPDEGNFVSEAIFFGGFAVILAVVVFCSALLARAPYYLPVVASIMTTAILLGLWHHDNDLTADAQAAISLVFIPIYAAGAALITSLSGFGLQEAIQSRRSKKQYKSEQATPRNPSD